MFKSGTKDRMIRHKTLTAGRKKAFEVWAAQRRDRFLIFKSASQKKASTSSKIRRRISSFESAAKPPDTEVGALCSVTQPGIFGSELGDMVALNVKAVPLKFKAGGGAGTLESPGNVAACVTGSNVSVF